jgi:hypothetical protein
MRFDILEASIFAELALKFAKMMSFITRLVASVRIMFGKTVNGSQV